MDPITKYILSEGEMDNIDKELDATEKSVKNMPKDSKDNFRKMKSMKTEEVLNRFMFEYISEKD